MLFYCIKQNPSVFPHIGTQLHVVSVDPDVLRASTELFIKNFFFPWSCHFSAFEPLNKRFNKKVHAISVFLTQIISCRQKNADVKVV